MRQRPSASERLAGRARLRWRALAGRSACRAASLHQVLTVKCVWPCRRRKAAAATRPGGDVGVPPRPLPPPAAWRMAPRASATAAGASTTCVHSGGPFAGCALPRCFASAGGAGCAPPARRAAPALRRGASWRRLALRLAGTDTTPPSGCISGADSSGGIWGVWAAAAAAAAATSAAPSAEAVGVVGVTAEHFDGHLRFAPPPFLDHSKGAASQARCAPGAESCSPDAEMMAAAGARWSRRAHV
jgi:hypothetical protein